MVDLIDIEDIEAAEMLELPRRHNRSRVRVNPIMELSDEGFRQKYRFKRYAMKIVDLVKEDLTRDGRGCPVSPEIQVCCALRSWARHESGIPKLKRLPAASEVASIDVVPRITTVYSTHIWASYMQVEKLPSIRGLFDRVAKVPFYQVSENFCLPFIDENPSDLKTIYTALHYAAQHCKETERKTCFVTFDNPLYIKAKQILCDTKDKNLQNLVPCLGGFHLLMSYLKAIGTIMESSDIFELFCTVFAQNSVDKMLSCTAYSRAIRAHMLAMNAIEEIIAEFAESSENIESHKNIEHIKESRPLEAPP
ncbi:unnamed protein product, partial [Brenthis ino]